VFNSDFFSIGLFVRMASMRFVHTGLSVLCLSGSDFGIRPSWERKAVANAWLGVELLDALAYHEFRNDTLVTTAANISLYLSIEREMNLRIDRVRNFSVDARANLTDSISQLKALLLARNNSAYQVTVLGKRVTERKIFQVAAEIADCFFDYETPEVNHLRKKLRVYQEAVRTNATKAAEIILDSEPAGPPYLAEVGSVILESICSPPAEVKSERIEFLDLQAALRRAIGLNQSCSRPWECTELLDDIKIIKYAYSTRPKLMFVPEQWLSEKELQSWEDYSLVVMARRLVAYSSNDLSINQQILHVGNNLRSLLDRTKTVNCSAETGVCTWTRGQSAGVSPMISFKPLADAVADLVLVLETRGDIVRRLRMSSEASLCRDWLVERVDSNSILSRPDRTDSVTAAERHLTSFEIPGSIRRDGGIEAWQFFCTAFLALSKNASDETLGVAHMAFATR